MIPETSAVAVALPTPVAAVSAERARPDMRLLGLALGHMVLDINQGSLSALRPFLKAALALSYTVGWIANHWGLRSSLCISALMPLLGFALSMFLPEPRTR